ncbi:SDR family NAD(P)-dependent oxidoreductase [Amycolatopsis sp. NPDC051716]|uniref:SDR family NAD(P)-dependent oxidoreductase n=1 Tax=Amycolatopsis sp. NPDC051716 TaxID=3155804 RepID=UPI0034447631
MNAEPVLVKVAGAGEEALRAQAERLASFAETADSLDLAAVAWTAGVGRADLPERAAVIASTRDELVSGLRAVAAGLGAPGVVRGRKAPGVTPRVALLAPGHGVPAVGLLAGVYGRVPVVTEVLDGLGGVAGLPLSVLVRSGPEYDAAFADTRVAQPAMYAMALGLGRWWQSVGVTPELLLGHSVGAYAAAALAGVFPAADGARLVAERGRLLGDLGPGAMLAVPLPAEEAARLPRVRSGDAEIAVHNGPRNTVLSGPAAVLDEVAHDLADRGVRATRLPVSRAFHSVSVEPVLEKFGEAFAGTTLRPPLHDLVSDSTGDLAGADVTEPGYWVRHLREPVRFDAAVRTLLARRATTLVELGPGALLPAAAGTAGSLGERLRGIATLPGHAADAHRGMLEAVGSAWAGGVGVDWSAVNPRPARPAKLPTYAFRRTPYRKAAGAIARPPAPPVAAAVPSPGPDRPRAGELVDWLRQELAVLTGSGEAVDADVGLFDLGLTSMMVVDLRNRLETRLGREIPATVVFDHPTIGRLAGFLAGENQAAPVRRERRAADAEPLAIVGMACRFPGGANDLAAFWRLLSEGRDAIGEVPADRGWSGLRGGFLDGPVDEFDADAFGISPREARGMDPQQRLLLEVAGEAIDDAGIATGALERSATSVFVGINTSDYRQLLAADESAGVDAYAATGTTFSVAAGRLSFLLGLDGPAMAIDTACSSSLVAAHLAARSLRSGESDLALVAGVNLMLSPVTTASLAKLNALSADGRCKTFDASADGYGRGEGCGVVVLKRLADAQAAGDRIWAVLRGTAVNQDGHRAGLTVPNGQAQRQVVRAALADAGVPPEAVGYVEAHGTGTPLGDPLELTALAGSLRASGDTGTRPPPLLVGSVKTNVGHLEAAAGVCGLIKVALMLHHRRIPPHLHFRDPNPHVDWAGLPVTVATELTDWAGERPRLAGLSSFGFSGTNAHAVLAEAPAPAAPDPDEEEADRAELLVVSASTAAGLDATVAAYGDYLRRTGDGWRDIARTAGAHRRHLPHRTAVVARSPREAADRLSGPAARTGRAAGPEDRPGLLFVYSGQGAQWPAMGDGLLADPAARAVLESCDEAVRELAGWSLLDELTAPREVSRLDDTRYAQPAIFAVQAALSARWRRWGVVPDAVIGHSVGEIAAAHTAGAFDLETALHIVVRRAEAMASTRDSGAMAAVGLPADAVEDLLGPFEGRLHVAAVNSPANTVVAGDRAALDDLHAGLAGRGVFWRVVTPHYAFHTPLMRKAAAELRERLDGLRPVPVTLPVFSTVHGGPAGPAAFTAGYWADNVVRPVRFRAALTAAAGSRTTTVVEVGPHAVLGTAVGQTLPGSTVLASMRAGRDPREVMLDAAGGLHVLGHEVDHGSLTRPGRRAALPPRQWVRSRHWLPARPTADRPAEALDRDVYEIRWRPRKLTAGVPQPPGGTWLVLADRSGLAGLVTAHLAAAGHATHVLEPAAVAEPDPAATRARLATVLAGLPDVNGVVHLGALDAGPVDGPGDELDRALTAACGPLLAAAGGITAGRLWAVTRGGVAAGGAPATPAQTPAWGLGRVVALEHPEIWGGLIDLDPAEPDPGSHAAAIVAELLGSDGEDQVAYRDGERLVARLERAERPPAARPGVVDPASAYLITGGRGALGLRIAVRLAERGARHLVLLGRRPPPEQAGRVLRQLADAGVTVHLPDADVADATAMAALFDTASTPWPPIRGVVHAAGVFTPTPIAAMTWPGFRDVLRAKVEGTLVLDAVTASTELDFFVMFSSASSVWGSALAGHYVAANHFLDVMAHERVRRGLPGLAINWGWWSDSDMAAHHAGYFEAMGLSVLPDAEGLDAFDRLLGSSRVQLTVAPVDWARFRPVLSAKRDRPLFADLDPDVGVPTGAVDTALLERLGTANAATRLRLAEDLVQQLAAAVLGRTDGVPLERELGFFSAGMDSITSVELKTRLESALGVQLPATVAFEHPNVAALARFLVHEVLEPPVPAEEPAAGTDVTPADALPDELAGLSEDELLRLLEAELEKPE